MAPKQSPQGALSAARWQGSHAGELHWLSLTEMMPWEGQFSFLRGGETSHSHLQLNIFSPFWNRILNWVSFPAQGGFRDLLLPFGPLDPFPGHIQAPDVEPGYSLGLWRHLIWVWGRLEKLLVYKSLWGSGRDGEEMHREKRESIRN